MGEAEADPKASVGFQGVLADTSFHLSCDGGKISTHCPDDFCADREQQPLRVCPTVYSEKHINPTFLFSSLP